jgi:uncharacterized membrane protein
MTKGRSHQVPVFSWIVAKSLAYAYAGLQWRSKMHLVMMETLPTTVSYSRWRSLSVKFASEVSVHGTGSVERGI